jgi:hypothetical protein
MLSVALMATPSLGMTTTEEDEVWITAMTPDEPETAVFYQGEQSIGLNVRFGQDYSYWSLDLDSPLFERYFPFTDYDDIKAGEWHAHALDLKPEALPGTYDIPVYLNCSNDNGSVNRIFDLQIILVQAWRVIDVHVPDGDDHKLSVKFETFVDFHNITILFGGDGDVGARDELIVMENVEPGVHTVETNVIQVESFPGNQQEISWDLMGVVDNRTLQKAEYNHNVSVSWGEKESPGFHGPLVLLAVIGVLVLTRWRTRKA